jgi:class 3 adenylate cyclase
VGRYTKLVDGLIDDYGGTVDKPIGDAVMALFGAPSPVNGRNRPLLQLFCSKRARVTRPRRSRKHYPFQ